MWAPLLQAALGHAQLASTLTVLMIQLSQGFTCGRRSSPGPTAGHAAPPARTRGPPPSTAVSSTSRVLLHSPGPCPHRAGPIASRLLSTAQQPGRVATLCQQLRQLALGHARLGTGVQARGGPRLCSTGGNQWLSGHCLMDPVLDDALEHTCHLAAPDRAPLRQESAGASGAVTVTVM